MTDRVIITSLAYFQESILLTPSVISQSNHGLLSLLE